MKLYLEVGGIWGDYLSLSLLHTEVRGGVVAVVAGQFGAG